MAPGQREADLGDHRIGQWRQLGHLRQSPRWYLGHRSALWFVICGSHWVTWHLFIACLLWVVAQIDSGENCKLDLIGQVLGVLFQPLIGETLASPVDDILIYIMPTITIKGIMVQPVDVARTVCCKKLCPQPLFPLLTRGGRPSTHPLSLY